MKHFAIASLCVLALVGCGGGSGVTPATIPTGPATPVNPVQWTEHAPVSGFQGNYLSFIVKGQELTVWTNFNGGDNTHDAKLYVHTGTLTQVGKAAVAFDLPGKYLRTFGLVRATEGCHVLARVGEAYGGNGYFPMYGFSADCLTNWQWTDKLWLGNSNSNTLTVGPVAPLDHVNPRSNRFTALDDSHGKKWSLEYSADGKQWFTYPNGQPVKELFPEPTGNPQFTAEVKTPFGWHAVSGNWSDSAGATTSHTHHWSTDGINWCVLEANSPTYSNPKGTALYYEPETGRVHSLSGGGRHLSFQAQSFTCPR